jgi:hypothetical protein
MAFDRFTGGALLMASLMGLPALNSASMFMFCSVMAAN